jgi:hypothetical protein
LDIKTFFSLLLSVMLLVPAPSWTQQASAPKANLIEETGKLKIVVLQGEGALNSIKSRTATQPVVEVRDESDKPVEGAEVVFQLPAAGAGGVFNGWMRTQTTRSNAQGQASASGMTPNDQEGRFNIKVTATQGKRGATAIIAQSNTVSGGDRISARSKHKALWIVLGLAAVGGIAGGIAGTRGGSTAAATVTTPVTITPGPVTVGTPR